jgi:nucleoside phosphorylase
LTSKITFATALYCEAQPFIAYYQLKKVCNRHTFQIFQNEDVQLIITGSGSINAAVAITYLCTLNPPDPSGILLNFGTCAAGYLHTPIGSVFLCNKITEQVTKKSFYPDVLFAHPFEENRVITCPAIVTGKADFDNNLKGKLMDMEASAIYQAAIRFYQTHQIVFLKMVSDYGTENLVNAERITGLIQNHLSEITRWIERIRQETDSQKPLFTDREEQYMIKLGAYLHCSTTMQYQLRQMLRYAKLENENFLKNIDDFIMCHGLQSNITKAEGKKYFEQLKKVLI